MTFFDFGVDPSLSGSVRHEFIQKEIFKWQAAVHKHVATLLIDSAHPEETFQQTVAAPETAAAYEKLKQQEHEDPSKVEYLFDQIFHTNPLLAIAAMQLHINTMCQERGYQKEKPTD